VLQGVLTKIAGLSSFGFQLPNFFGSRLFAANCNFQSQIAGGSPACKLASQPMEEKRMKLESLHELFVAELQDLYSAENMTVNALPKVIEKVSSHDLKTALTEHLEETKVQVDRLDQIFDQLGDDEVDRKGKKCKGMDGILKENKEFLGEDAEPEVLDAGVIAGAQKVEHYEIAGYGTVRNYASLLGRTEWMGMLEVTLEEEKAADKKLSQLAEKINVQAKAA